MRNTKAMPKSQTLQELSEFWDTHSLADVWEQTTPASFDVAADLGSRALVSVDPELLQRVRQLAAHRGLQTESMVNLLLEQRMHELTA